MILTLRRTGLIAALALILASTFLVTSSAQAASTVSLTGYGADSCTAPSTSQMSAFWNNTPYSYWGIYIGGSDRGCSQPNLTKAWVTAEINQGWDLLPIWVGPQNPCTAGQASYFSTNTTTAASQGKAEALAAYNAWRTLSTSDSVPITYDLEAPSSNSATCRAAAKAFVNGWVAQMHVAPAQTAGVYSSSCAGDIQDFSGIANVPDFIDAADWDGSPSTGSISCIGSGSWSHTQRHKQYQGGHNATYNGVTLNIDSDCANGPVYGAAGRTSTTQACAPSSATTIKATTMAQAAAAPVTWQGATWSAGGPLDSQLQRSTAGAAPAAVAVADLPVVTHDVAPDAPTVGTPAVLPDGSLLVPVTRHLAGSSEEDLYTTTDGSHWSLRTSIPLAGAASPGVAATASVQPGSAGAVSVFDPAGIGGQVWTAATGARSALADRGLPASPEAASWTSAGTGTAVVAGTCPAGSGKSGCVPTARTFATSDGGQSWSAQD